MWLGEKQRRSRVDWFAIVPEEIAVAQVAWERRQTALAMQDAGMKQGQIAELFGVTKSRVSQMTLRASAAKRAGKSSPAEAYLNPAPRKPAIRTHTGMRYVMRLPKQGA